MSVEGSPTRYGMCFPSGDQSVGSLNRGGAAAGAPVSLFSFAPGGNLVTPDYSVMPDGQRFVLSKLVQRGVEVFPGVFLPIRRASMSGELPLPLIAVPRE